MARSTNDTPIATSRRGGKYLVNYGRGMEPVSQGRYRSALAQIRGGMTRSERVDAIKMTKAQFKESGLTARQKALLAGALIDTKGRVDALPARLAATVAASGGSIWSVARTLY